MKFLKRHSKLIILADQGIISGTNFLNAILIAKFLGVHYFGVFAMCLLAVQFLSSIQQALIIKPLLSLYPEKSQQDKSYLAKLNTLQLLFTLSATTLFIPTIYGLSFFFEEFNSTGLLLYLALYAGLISLYDYIRRVFILKGNIITLFLLDAIVYGTFISLTIIQFIMGTISVDNLLFSYAAVLFVAILAGVTATKENWWQLHGLRTVLKELWQYARFLVYTSILQWFSGNLFILFAGLLLGPVSLGVVRIAQSIMGVFNVFFLALENIVPLKAAYIKVENEKMLIPYFKKTTLKFAVPVVGVALCLALFDKEIISFVFDQNLDRFGYVIIAFAALYLLVYLNTMQQFFIRTIQSNHIIFKSYLVASIFGILFSKLMISHWGLSGVLIGLFISQILVNTVNYQLIKRTIK
jgi:O-antigen/teichoic acid export membrane protein